MNSKKAITLLVLTTLLLTLVPLTTSYAIAYDGVWAVGDDRLLDPETYTGVYEDQLFIYGSGVTAGKNVEVYWDSVDAWNGVSGLLNVTKAKSSGEFELWFEIPEAVNGEHYLWLRDSSNGDTMVVATPITVNAFIEVKPGSGLPGDELTIWGYGFGEEVDIDDVTFDLVSVPTSPGTPTTDELGSWNADFDIPDATLYGAYDVTATDEDLNAATDSVTVGASVTSNIDEGNSGAVVRLSGRGFNPSGTIVDIYISDGVTDYTCYLLDEDDDGITSRGTFTTDIVIPSVDDVGDWEIFVEDNSLLEGSVEFEVLGLPGIITEPEYGVQGSTVAVMGYNYSKVSGEPVTLWLLPELGTFPADLVEIKDIDTESDGTFEGTMKIPAVASGIYYLYGTQFDWGVDNIITDTVETFKVGLTIVILSPDAGPTGEYVSMTASGLTGGGDFQFNISDTVILEGTVEPDGAVSEMFTVPVFDPGVYTASLLDVDTDIMLTTEYEVTERAMVETSPLQAPAGYTVDVMGWYFSQNPSETDLDFILYNDTEEFDMDVLYEGFPVAIGDDEDWDDGYFEGEWEVLDLDLGSYMMNVTDGADILAHYEFNVVSKIEEIEPRKTTFRIGETVSFDVVSTFGQPDSYIEIYTPDGELYWKTEPFVLGDWIEVGTELVYPSFNQIADGNLMTLLEDAPTGTWEWSWFDDEDEELDSGTFEVEASSADVLGQQVEDLNNKITDLSSQVDSVSSEFDDVKSDIADVAAIAEQAVTAAQQAAEAVETVAQTANQANTAAENAATAAEAARDAANGLTTLVYGAIGAALVAALAAIVSLMQISRRIAG